jgi:phage replication-related protein YjqB (UPF0714/DUF867 family)
LSCISSEDESFEGFQQFRATSVIDVKGPAQGQELTRADHCSLAMEFGNRFAPGDQVRIYRTADECGLYTVSELRNELDAATVRMSKSGRARLGSNGGFVGQLDTRITVNELTDEEAALHGEFIERLVDDGVHAGLLVAAAHGGKIELNTDRQAELLASLLPGVSSWICKGWGNPDGAYTRWHVDSDNLSPNSFAGLGAIADRGFKHVVSFHGMSTGGMIIGGRAPLELREELRAAIIAAIPMLGNSIVVSGEDGPLSGVQPGNFVNWLTADGEGGIQIEQGPTARSLYWAAITEAIAAFIEPML